MTDLPIFNSLRDYAKTAPISFHMPGHKGGEGLIEEFISSFAAVDVTEIPGTDNLHFPEGIIMEAQMRAAKVFGAQHTFFLVNGSTCGLHAAILSICSRGDKLLVARNCHKSIIAGIFLAGANPIFLQPEFETNFAIASEISPNEVERMILLNPDAKGVVITSPNFYGVCSNIKEIADIVHKHGKILLVDEAHGAHLKFSLKLPLSALESGADICVQSAHKTLPALTQSSYLHVNSDRVDVEKIKFILGIIQSSSPSYVLLSSLDIARWIMETKGEVELNNLINHIEGFKCKLNRIGNYSILGKEHILNGNFDETRIVVNSRRIGITGFEADQFLRRKFNIQVEMSDMYNVICICSIANKKTDLEALYYALVDLSKDNINNDEIKLIDNINFAIPQKKATIDEALTAKNELVDLKKSNGRAVARLIIPYPPGIPIVCPGEIINEEIIDYLCRVIKLEGSVNGISKDMKVLVIK